MIRFLADASLQNRILATFDLRTMPRHFGNFLEASGLCTGVFLVKQRAPLADVIEALVLVWAASDADEWKTDRGDSARSFIRPIYGRAASLSLRGRST